MHADHHHVDPRPAGTRRFMMLTLKIPPCYLTTNQSEGCPQADHTPATLSLTLSLNTLPESHPGVLVF